ncbi:MAG: HAMP domain-containing histidine kinase [Gemmatimonadetes bacterium]|nr:HAMP domain-containing histidine kinase [Gemmatimonadota bacterium]
MSRRAWPVVLAIAAALVFVSYLAYTQYLFREIKTQTVVTSQIYSLVQRGMLAEPGTNEDLAALVDIQQILTDRGVPMVYINNEGVVAAAVNHPPEYDINTPEGAQALAEYAALLERRNPANKVVVPGLGTVIFGDPPLLGWLRWVPWLQVLAGLVLVAVAFAVIRVETRAERERLWAAMARELAHQMGTPLSSLAGWIEVLSLPHDERQGLATDQHIADVIAADVERLERVSRRFELIGKPQALDVVALEDVVRDVEHYFRPRLPRLGNGITLRTRIARSLPAVRANRVLLSWALENVVKNAVDALGGRGGRILVFGHVQGNGPVHVLIADDGPGIPAAVSSRIFDAGVTSKPGGWGVGLSLTRRIVHDLHGGRIVARSRPGGGTVFDITLPAIDDRRTNSAAAGSRET